ncbi:MAG: TonB-dependent receptor [Sphingobium sp.]
MAQDQGAASQDGLTDIIVTARRVAENLQNIPVSVTALSGAQLEAANVVRLDDVARLAPGFSAHPATRNATALTLTIRGQVQNETLATVEPSIGTYVDDVYWARAQGLNSSLLDVSNVQVLKGPQGTLFGRNTAGGALVLTTNDPSFDAVSAKISGTYGRFDERTGEAVINVPIGDVVALRGAIRLSKRDGWAYGVALYNAAGQQDNSLNPASTFQRTGKKYNDRDELQGRIKALINLGETTRMILSADWYDYQSQGTARQMIYKLQNNAPASDAVAFVTPVNRYIDYFRTNPNAVGGGGIDCVGAVSTTTGPNCTSTLVPSNDTSTDVHTSTYSARLISDTSFGQAKLIAAYRNVNSFNMNDLDGTGILLHATESDNDLSQYSVEGQVTGQAFDDFLDFAAGLTYLREKGRERLYSFSNAGGNPTASVTRQWTEIDNHSYGVYGQASAHLTDKLTLTAGLRYSIDKKGIRLANAVVDRNGVVFGGLPTSCFVGGTPANDCFVADRAKFKAASWTASLDYKATEDVLLFVKASRGYRSGGLNFGASSAAQFVPFKPEFVNEQEAGIKAQLFANRVRANLAIYHNTLSDAQRSALLVTNGVTTTLLSNAAKARNYGIEGDLMVRPFKGLTLNASASMNKGKYLQFADVSGDRTGERFVFTPKYQFNLGGEYAVELAPDILATLNLTYSWIDEQATASCALARGTPCYAGPPDANGRSAADINADIVRATTLPATGLLNARLGFDFGGGKYEVDLWGRNITNVRKFSDANYVPAPHRNYSSGGRTEPATYGVTLRASF